MPGSSDPAVAPASTIEATLQGLQPVDPPRVVI
jgi:hypothetical protein